MLFKYEATTLDGENKSGSIEAANIEIAISSIQRRGMIIVSINPVEDGGAIWERNMKLFERVKMKDTVVLSRQLSTLFGAKVQVLDSFKMLASESENPVVRRSLSAIVEDIQGGLPMSQAMAKHPDVFSKFYVSMVRSGEESGRLDEVFNYLADYLERSYDLTSKARGAMFYPAFIIFSFFVVMVLMMAFVVPKLTDIIKETGMEIPFQTKMIMFMSDMVLNYGVVLLVLLAGGIIALWRYSRTEMGRNIISAVQFKIPIVGGLLKKLYLSRICDNLNTMLSSGIPIVRSLEITADVVGNKTYEKILLESVEAVRGGDSISSIFSRYDSFPPLIAQMVRIGEESGKLNYILGTLAGFYKREVDNMVDNLMSLIEPIIIVVLAVGVGFLLVSILGPIYNITSSVS